MNRWILMLCGMLVFGSVMPADIEQGLMYGVRYHSAPFSPESLEKVAPRLSAAIEVCVVTLTNDTDADLRLLPSFVHSDILSDVWDAWPCPDVSSRLDFPGSAGVIPAFICGLLFLQTGVAGLMACGVSACWLKYVMWCKERGIAQYVKELAALPEAGIGSYVLKKGATGTFVAMRKRQADAVPAVALRDLFAIEI
jgi:hypothetical protein